MLDSQSLRDSAAAGNPTGALKSVNFKTVRKLTIVAFCAAYLLVQAFFIIRAHFRVDKRFGFWMFAESSRYYLDERIPEDQETVKLILKVQYRKAGGPWQHLTLESKSRDLSGNSG